MTTLNFKSVEEAFLHCRDMDASLRERLDAFSLATRHLLPGYQEAVDRMVDRLKQHDAGKSAPKPDDLMPGFVLPDEEGRLVSLDDLLRAGSRLSKADGDRGPSEGASKRISSADETNRTSGIFKRAAAVASQFEQGTLRLSRSYMPSGKEGTMDVPRCGWPSKYPPTGPNSGSASGFRGNKAR